MLNDANDPMGAVRSHFAFVSTRNSLSLGSATGNPSSQVDRRGQKKTCSIVERARLRRMERRGETQRSEVLNGI